MRHLNGVYTKDTTAAINATGSFSGGAISPYYKKWVAEDTEDEISQKIGGVKWPVCFGSQAFVDRIKEKYGAGKLDKEVPSSRELLPNVTLIIETVCNFFDVSDSEIFKSRKT